MKQSIKDNLELYKAIIDDAVDAIFIGDKKGNFVLVNKSAEELTGYSRENLLKMNISDLFTKEILEMKPLDFSSLNSNNTISNEREIIRKDGSIIPVEMRSKKLPTGNYQSFVRDISERKRIEKEVNALNERYKTLFEFSPVGIVIEDKDGNIIDANPEFHQIFKFEPKSLIGKNINVVALPNAKIDSKNNIEKILKGKNLHHTVKSVTKYGTEIYTDLHETKIILPGLQEGILSISNDITKEVEAENKLKENELRYRNIIEHSSNMFYTHDSTNKLTYVSPQVRKFLDCEPEEAMVEWTSFLTENPINKAGIEKTKRAFETGIDQGPYELELSTKKGRTIIVEVNESPIVENGRTTLLVGALSDITDRKIKEAELEKSHKRFRELFEYSPIPILEEDVTELFNFFDQLKASSISDLNKYFEENPSKVNECVNKITPLRINKAGLELYGFTGLNDYIVNFKNIFTPKSLLVFRKQLISFFEGSSIFSAETETITRSDEHKYLYMKIQLLPATKLGRVIALFSLIDITEQKKIEIELLETKNQFQLAIEGSNIGLWDWDIQTGITTVNDRFAAIIGYTKEELGPINDDLWKTIVHPEDINTIRDSMEPHFEGKTDVYFQSIRVKHKNGKWKWIQFRGKVVDRDDKGNPNRMVGTHIDITNQKLADAELKKSEERFRILFEYAAVPIWIEDFSKVKKWLNELNESGVVDIEKYLDDHPKEVNKLAALVKVIDVNQKSVDFYDAKSKDNLIVDLPSYFTKESISVFKKEIVAISKGLKQFEDEIPIRTPDGQELQLHINLSIPPAYADTLERVFVSFIDITEATKNTKLLKRSLKDLETLFILSQEMIQNLNTQDIIKSIPNHIVKTSISAESSSLWEYDEFNELFKVVAEHGYGNRKIKDLTLPISNTIIGEIYRTQKPVICNNTSEDPKYMKVSGGLELTTKSTIGVPLISGNSVPYVIFADNFTDTNIFTSDDLNLLQSFANIASIAINNSMLYDKIKESEARYRSIFDSVGESIFIHDAETGAIIDVNQKMMEIYGFTYEESLNLKPEESSSGVPPFTPENALEYVNKAKTEGPQLFEWYAKKKNGELFWTEVNLRKAIIGDEERIIAVVRDIDERKKIEQAFAATEAKIETIMRSAPVGIGLIRNRILEYVNNNLLQLLGYEKDEMLGKSSSEFYESMEDFDKIGKLYKEIGSKEIAASEARVRRKDNTVVDVIISLSPIDKSDFNEGIIFSVLDITENKKTQDRYLLERSRYKNLFENSPIPLWEEDFTELFVRLEEIKKAGVTDLEIYLDENPEVIYQLISLPKILNVNQAALKLHKAKNKKELFSGLQDVFTENSLPTFKKEIVAIFNGQKYFATEGEVKTLDGEIKIVDLKLYLDYESSFEKDMYRALLATIDVTEQKMAEEALKSSEYNLKEAQRIAQIGHWELDLKQNNLYWSDEVYRIFDLEPQEFGATYEAFLDKVHEEDRDLVNDAYTSSVENKTPYSIVHKLKLSANKIKYVREIGQTFYDENNQPVKSVGTVQDITDRILAEKEIKEYLERNEIILNAINDGFILADDKGKIIDVNPAYSKMIGYSFEELKKMDIRDIEISIPSEEVDRRIQQMVTKGYDVFQTQHRAKDGKILDLDVSIAIIKQDSNVFVAAFVRDITLQQETLRKLKNSREEISELAQHLQDIREEERRNISREIHDDLGQSLTALKLDTSILLSKIPNAEPAVVKKLSSMKDLADQTIKTVQKISADLRPGILDDLGLIAAIEWEVNKFKERISIDCELNIEPKEFSLDDKLNITIFRIFQESCTNIARHSKATKVKITLKYSHSKFFMSIKDNGIGITKEEINSSKSFGIIGIRERLQNLNGNIKFYSKQNKGTNLIVEIPLNRRNKNENIDS